MSSALRYDYGIQWREVVKVFVVSAGISFILACWAVHVGGLFSIVPMFLSVIFALLALLGLTRRLMFQQVLELTDDAILFPRGFSGKRITRLPFADILRMRNTGLYPGIYLITTKGNFEILSIRFRNMESYNTVRAFICAKTSLSLPEGKPATWNSSWVPGPILKWSEPEDYIRYRTHLVASKPLRLRLARAIRFFACIFGFFFVPWFALNFFLALDAPVGGVLIALIPACLFFTLLYWLYAAHPARVRHITVFPEGFSVLSGKQTANFGFGDFLGWSVIIREFEGHVFHILLLQRPKYIFGIAFPNTDTRDQFIQMLNEKKVLELNSLKPSWELKP